MIRFVGFIVNVIFIYLIVAFRQFESWGWHKDAVVFSIGVVGLALANYVEGKIRQGDTP
jgi:hypothetical protein